MMIERASYGLCIAGYLASQNTPYNYIYQIPGYTAHDRKSLLLFSGIFPRADACIFFSLSHMGINTKRSQANSIMTNGTSPLLSSSYQLAFSTLIFRSLSTT
jgi:hypothetical protein